MRKGFTLLEIVLTLGLLSVFFLIGFQSQTIFQNVLGGRGSRQIESVLTTAAEHARSGANGSDWGVYFSYDESTRIATRATIFSGSTYATRDVTQDVEFPLGNSLKLNAVSLSGSNPSTGNDHEIVFAFLSGKTVQYGSITIQSYASTTELDISPIGVTVTH